MSKFRKIIVPVFLLVLVVFVSGCGINNIESVATNKKTVDDPQNNEEQIENNSSEATNTDELPVEDITSDIDTSDWQTYRNEEYGFDIKYPSSWILQDESQISLGKERGLVIVHNKKEKDEETAIFISGNYKMEQKPGDVIRNISDFEFLNPIVIDGQKTYLSYKRKEFEKWVFRYFIEYQNSYLQIYYRSEAAKDKDVIYGIIDSIKFFNKN